MLNIAARIFTTNGVNREMFYFDVIAGNKIEHFFFYFKFEFSHKLFSEKKFLYDNPERYVYVSGRCESYKLFTLSK